jgi:hypothetical protein
VPSFNVLIPHRATFYDIWYLKNNLENIDWQIIVNAFHEKMAFKNLTFTGINQMINEENNKHLKASWINSLAHQIHPGKLPEYERVKSELLLLFEKIFNIYFIITYANANKENIIK